MISMKKKKQKCEYCGDDLNAKSPLKRFCGDICRIYFKRDAGDPKYLQRKIKAVPTPEFFDSPKMDNPTHDEPPMYRVDGVFIPETTEEEKIDYRIEVQPLIVQIDPELEKQIPREVLIEISKKCPYKNGIKRTEHIHQEKCDWLLKNKLKNNQ